MRLTGVATATAFLLALILGAWPAAAVADPGFVPHQLVVGYRPGRVDTGRATAQAEVGPRTLHFASEPRTVLLTLPRSENLAAAAARLRGQPGIAFAEPNYIARAAADFYPNDRGKSNTTEGWMRMQWNLLPTSGVNAPEAWANLIADRRPGGRGVVVAILDTGVAYRNWRQFRRSPDFAGTRFVAPYDFVSHNHRPLDRVGHGTFVAGVVAEATNNHYGLTGLAYGASIMPVRILDANGLGDESTIARGIRYAVSHGAQVINLSLEFLPSEVTRASQIPEITSAIAYAHQHGVVVVGAAGNDQDTRVAYPARDREVISVGATTKDRCLADYSNGGVGLDLVAPGGGSDAIMPGDPGCHPDRSLPPIYQLTLTSTKHFGQFGYPDYYIGTSMSAPEVAGAAALVIASRVIGDHPTPAQVAARLEQTATPLGDGRPEDSYGHGLLNAGAATAVVGTPRG